MSRWLLAALQARAFPGAGLCALLLVLAVLLVGSGAAHAAGGCSPYMGQVVINEVRVGKSNSADIKNQIELYNSGSVAAAVWQTWSVVVYGGDNLTKAVKKGTYPMSTGFSANGLFIYNSNVKMWARNGDNNGNPRASDFAVFDANGDIVVYIAIGVGAQTIPPCYGSKTTIKATNGGDNTGGVMRPIDGTGVWPTQVPKTSVHTIGRTNACSADADIVVGVEVNYDKPVQNTTTVTYVITAYNNACSVKITGPKLTITNLNATQFSSLSSVASAGSGAVTTSGSDLLWDVKDLNAGVARTLTVTGIPKNLGALTSVATTTAPTTGLINTGDDSDSALITVYAYNYIGLQLASDTATEGTTTAMGFSVIANVPPSANVTVNYTVSGSAGAGDTNLTSGSVVLPAGSEEVAVNFNLLDDSLYEPTETLVITLSSVSSTDAKVAKGTAGTGDTLVETITIYDDEPPVDHYEISLPSSSLACLPSTVTVTACADASSPCTNRSTGVSGATATLGTSAGSLGATSISFDGNGVASTTLSHAAAADGAVVRVTLSGASTGATNAAQCCPDGINCALRNHCDSSFHTAGFIIASAANGASATLPTQTAGTSSGHWILRAVKSGTGTKACESALSGTTNVNWAYQCNNPSTCAAGNRLVLTGNGATTIAANPNSGVSSTTAVAMSFDANGNAPFSFSYADVGRITLHASKPAGGSLLTPLSGASNAFVVKPAGFVLSDIKCSSYTAGACATAAIASPGNNPGAAAGSGTAFIPAGRAFSATVTAVDASGGAVPNFGRETSPEGVTLAHTLVAPAGGNAGSLSNAAGFGSFSGGAATGTTFAYSEVGIITLTPSLSSGNYLGSGGAVTGTPSGHVGRFIPDHFTTVVTPGCAASFTYSGQPFAATLSAHNAAGAVVGNYAGTGFAKAVSLADAGAAGAGGFSAGGSVAAAAFTAGIASAAPVYAYTNKLTAPGTLTLRATDSDGVSSAGHAEGSTGLRSGRLRVANGFGRETTALQLAVRTEYWTGAAWLLNGSDSCTTVPAAAVALGQYRNHLGASTAAWSTGASAVSISAGSGLLTLAAPTPAATGSVALALNLGSTTADQSCTAGLPASTGAGLPWLRALNGACAATADRDPAARASFGIYSPETRKTVHARELF